MELTLYLDPVSPALRQPGADGSLARHVQFLDRDKNHDVASFPVVFLGLTDERNSLNNGVGSSADLIRQYLYSLYLQNDSVRILDLGNLVVGNTVNDTYKALSDVLVYILGEKAVPLVFGASQDMCVSMVKSLAEICGDVNIALLDSRFDIGGDDDFHSRSAVRKVITDYPSARVSFIAGQAYLIPKVDSEFVAEKHHTVVRLGKVRDNMQKVEPVVRDADAFVCDVGSIRQCDAPGNVFASPNGLSAEEACQIVRYAGLSERSRLFFLCECNAARDTCGQTSHLSAQLIWHYLDGFLARKGDFPVDPLDAMQKYVVTAVESDLNMTFYKSLKSDRWWIHISDDRALIEKVVACNYDDYLCACQNVIPDIYLDEISRILKH